MDNKIKVIDENQIEHDIDIITVFNHKDKEYVLYALDNDDDTSSICVSRLTEDENGHKLFQDITDIEEKKEIDNQVKDIIAIINK